MKSDGSFITVANASISVIIVKISDDELLANVNNFMHIFTDHIDQFYGEFA